MKDRRRHIVKGRMELPLIRADGTVEVEVTMHYEGAAERKVIYKGVERREFRRRFPVVQDY